MLSGGLFVPYHGVVKHDQKGGYTTTTGPTRRTARMRLSLYVVETQSSSKAFRGSGVNLRAKSNG